MFSYFPLHMLYSATDVPLIFQLVQYRQTHNTSITHITHCHQQRIADQRKHQGRHFSIKLKCLLNIPISKDNTFQRIMCLLLLD